MKISKFNFLIFTLTLCLLIILPINAQILTGTLGSSQINSTFYNITSPSDGANFASIRTPSIQYAIGINTLVRFDNGIRPFLSNVYSGNATKFTGKIGVDVICNGTMGYARLWDNNIPANEVNGYQYLVFDSFNPLSYTGAQTIVLTLDDGSTLDGLLSTALIGGIGTIPNGKFIFGTTAFSTSIAGNYLQNTQVSIINTYAITKPAGLGIVGVVTKTIDTTVYPSKAYIYDGDTNLPLVSQNTITSDNLLFDVPATTIYVKVQDSLLNWYNSTKLFTSGLPTATITPTPTITLAATDVWSMGVYPSAINLHDSAQLDISCTNSSKMSAAKIVLYYENNNLGSSSTWNLIGVYRYNSSTSNWDFRINNNVEYDFSSHDPSLLMVTPATTGTYSYQAAIFGANSEAFGTANGQLLIGAQGGQSSVLTMTLSALDQLTTSHLSNYHLLLEDSYGTSHDYDVVYDTSVSLQRGSVYTLTGSKSGYDTNSITFTVPVDQGVINGDFRTFISVGLYPSGQHPSAGNCSVTVHVDDLETYYPIPNAQVSMSGYNIAFAPKFTGTSGESVSFILPQNTGFTVSASKTGYCGSSDTGNTSTQTSIYQPLYLKFGACAGVQPTHTPIPNATPIITIPTPIYGQQNNLTVGVCNSNTTNQTPWLVGIRNYVACSGINDLTSQNALIALIIILSIGFIAASKAKAIGFAIGAVLGAIISLMLGLIPLWAIIILVIISIGILTLKIFFTKEG
jgi:hypothetical protein